MPNNCFGFADGNKPPNKAIRNFMLLVPGLLINEEVCVGSWVGLYMEGESARPWLGLCTKGSFYWVLRGHGGKFI